MNNDDFVGSWEDPVEYAHQRFDDNFGKAWSVIFEELHEIPGGPDLNDAMQAWLDKQVKDGKLAIEWNGRDYDIHEL